MMPTPSESQVQQAILAYLGLLRQQGKVYWVRNNSFAGFVQRSNGSLGRINNASPGTPDILVCYRGCFIGFEVKSAKGQQSATQKFAQREIEDAGGIYIVVRSVDEVKHFLDEF